jgi:large subunit ribosomal protein L7Ae
MPIYVRFDPPEELVNRTYEAVEKTRDTGKIKKGTNEVTKQVERGQAKLVVMASDVSPEEILVHMPVLCQEKNVPYTYVPSRMDLGRSAGLNTGTACLALVDAGEAKDLLEKIIKEITELQGQ